MSVNVRGEDHSIRFAQFEPTQAPFGVHDGAMWYDLQANTFKCRIAGSTTSCGGSGGSPGGSNTQVQFNDGGTFGGVSNFFFDKTTGSFAVVGGAGANSGVAAGTSSLNSISVNGGGVTLAGNEPAGTATIHSNGLVAIQSVNSNVNLTANASSGVISTSSFQVSLTTGANIVLTSNQTNTSLAGGDYFAHQDIPWWFATLDFATAIANSKSPPLALGASTWTGGTSQNDGYFIESVPDPGTSPVNRLRITRNTTFFANSNGGSVFDIGATGVGGTLRLAGNTSGVAAISVAAVAGTPNTMNLPTTTGAKNSIIQSDGGNPQQLSWSGNCTSSASPAVCGSAVAGSVVVAAAATTVVVNTTAVTANSQILLTEDSSLGSKLSVTCNTQSTLVIGSPTVSARTAGTSFTITLPVAPTTNPACFSYLIVN